MAGMVREEREDLTVDFYVVREMAIDGIDDLLPVDIALIYFLLDGFGFLSGLARGLGAIGNEELVGNGELAVNKVGDCVDALVCTCSTWPFDLFQIFLKGINSLTGIYTEIKIWDESNLV